MTPQIDNQIDSTTTTVTLPSKTYKLNITGQDNGSIPKFREVDYLESTGEQVIFPDITLNTTTDVTVKFALTDLSHTTGVVAGAVVSNELIQPVISTSMYLYTEQGKSLLQRNALTSKALNINTPDLDIHTIEFKNDVDYYFDGVLKGQMNPSRPNIRITKINLFGSHTSARYRSYSYTGTWNSKEWCQGKNI